MKNNVIISLADSNYFNLLEELIQSIKSFKESENTAICILDAGLTENQKKLYHSSPLSLLYLEKRYLQQYNQKTHKLSLDNKYNLHEPFR